MPLIFLKNVTFVWQKCQVWLSLNDNDNRFHTESALKSTGFLPKDADLGGGGLELGSSYSLYSPRISAFFAVANEMLT